MVDGHAEQVFAKTQAEGDVQEMLVLLAQGAVGDHQGYHRADHQQHAAGGLAMNELVQRGQQAVEGSLPGGVVNAFFHGLQLLSVNKRIGIQL